MKLKPHHQHLFDRRFIHLWEIITYERYGLPSLFLILSMAEHKWIDF